MSDFGKNRAVIAKLQQGLEELAQVMKEEAAAMPDDAFSREELNGMLGATAAGLAGKLAHTLMQVGFSKELFFQGFDETIAGAQTDVLIARLMGRDK